MLLSSHARTNARAQYRKDRGFWIASSVCFFLSLSLSFGIKAADACSTNDNRGHGATSVFRNCCKISFYKTVYLYFRNRKPTVCRQPCVSCI
uniref:Uncharacterized protein n=1 Tax=Anopheles quadriannulatus TaxID=34691 RepID=A0A182XT25_ANOQN